MSRRGQPGEGLVALLVLALAAHPRFDLKGAAVVLLGVVVTWLGAVIAARTVLRTPPTAAIRM